MLEISISECEKLKVSHLVLDYNGTIALNGIPIEGIKKQLEILSKIVKIHVLTADTFGTVKEQLRNLSIEVVVLQGQSQEDVAKADYVKKLGSKKTICIGNGWNDRLMLREAAVGIAVLQLEGAAVEAILAADIIVPNIIAAFELLKNPLRMTATLRNKSLNKSP